MVTVNKEVKGNAMLDPGQVSSIINEDLQRKQINTTNLNKEDTYKKNLESMTRPTDGDVWCLVSGSYCDNGIS